jgi:hypothetical protein
MATYTQLSDDEKAQIKIAAKRNLEYQMYALEVDILVENAKATPDASRVADIQAQIAEKEDQIAAIA